MDRAARTQPLRRKKRTRASQILSFGRVLIWVILIFLCVSLVGAIIAAVQVPAMTADLYGPPSPALSPTQRLLYSTRLLLMRDTLLTPYDPTGINRTFVVELGESVQSIAFRLENERLIGSADAFTTYLVYAGLDTAVQAGKYNLGPAMTPVEIARSLQDPVPEDVAFNILPGWRLEEIAAALPTSGIEVTPEEFLEVVYNPTIQPAGLSLDSLEGFMMPGAYIIKRDITAIELAQTFVLRFEENVSPAVQQAFADQGLDLYEAVTLASIVQREAVVEEEQPLIASVFYNRLGIGMKLDSDPTVQYALGYNAALSTWWKSPLFAADLQIDSRYNTYIYAGLPPGPIANPGMAALLAVASPEQSEFFFFRALCDGSRRHAFAVTYEEHLMNACP